MTLSSHSTRNLIRALEEASEGEFRRSLRISTKQLRKMGFQEGRKAILSSAATTTLRGVMATSAATLAEQFLEEMTKIETRIAETSFRIESEQLKIENFKVSEVDGDGIPYFEQTLSAVATKMGSRRRSEFKKLDNAAEFLKSFRIEDAKRSKIKFEADAIRARQQEQERVSDLRMKHLEELLKLKEALAAVEEEKSQAPRRYAQKFLRMTSVSEACWAQYCAGYQRGKAKIRPRLRFKKSARAKERNLVEEKAAMPNPELHLDFERPSIFNFN